MYWTLRAGERVVENAAWSCPDPPPGAPLLRDYVAFYWKSMDGWLEEDEPAIGHVRDPYHRVDVLDASRHVRVSIAGTVLAEGRHARVLFETGLPPRWYFPREYVRAELISTDLWTCALTRITGTTSPCAPVGSCTRTWPGPIGNPFTMLRPSPAMWRS